MTKGSDMAYPLFADEDVFSSGLTKREYFAMAAMQGRMATAVAETEAHSLTAKIAVEQADALIEALNSQAVGIVEKTDDV